MNFPTLHELYYLLTEASQMKPATQCALRFCSHELQERVTTHALVRAAHAARFDARDVKFCTVRRPNALPEFIERFSAESLTKAAISPWSDVTVGIPRFSGLLRPQALADAAFAILHLFLPDYNVVLWREAVTMLREAGRRARDAVLPLTVIAHFAPRAECADAISVMPAVLKWLGYGYFTMADDVLLPERVVEALCANIQRSPSGADVFARSPACRDLIDAMPRLPDKAENVPTLLLLATPHLAVPDAVAAVTRVYRKGGRFGNRDAFSQLRLVCARGEAACQQMLDCPLFVETVQQGVAPQELCSVLALIARYPSCRRRAFELLAAAKIDASQWPALGGLLERDEATCIDFVETGAAVHATTNHYITLTLLRRDSCRDPLLLSLVKNRTREAIEDLSGLVREQKCDDAYQLCRALRLSPLWKNIDHVESGAALVVARSLFGFAVPRPALEALAANGLVLEYALRTLNPELLAAAARISVANCEPILSALQIRLDAATTVDKAVHLLCVAEALEAVATHASFRARALMLGTAIVERAVPRIRGAHIPIALHAAVKLCRSGDEAVCRWAMELASTPRCAKHFAAVTIVGAARSSACRADAFLRVGEFLTCIDSRRFSASTAVALAEMCEAAVPCDDALLRSIMDNGVFASFIQFAANSAQVAKALLRIARLAWAVPSLVARAVSLLDKLCASLPAAGQPPFLNAVASAVCEMLLDANVGAERAAALVASATFQHAFSRLDSLERSVLPGLFSVGLIYAPALAQSVKAFASTLCDNVYEVFWNGVVDCVRSVAISGHPALAQRPFDALVPLLVSAALIPPLGIRFSLAEALAMAGSDISTMVDELVDEQPASERHSTGYQTALHAACAAYSPHAEVVDRARVRCATRLQRAVDLHEEAMLEQAGLAWLIAAARVGDFPAMENALLQRAAASTVLTNSVSRAYDVPNFVRQCFTALFFSQSGYYYPTMRW